jgi:nitroreductase
VSNVLETIKRRASIRRYNDRHIPKRDLDIIIEAGVWGPSVLFLQPWKYVVVRNKKIIRLISAVINKKAKGKNIGVRSVMRSSANTIASADTLICVYDSQIVLKFAKKFGREHLKFSRIASAEAIAAAIQNMLLVAEDLSLGACWFDIVLLCETQINNILKVKGDKLIAILTFGYPGEKGMRSKRRPISEILEFVE